MLVKCKQNHCAFWLRLEGALERLHAVDDTRCVLVEHVDFLHCALVDMELLDHFEVDEAGYAADDHPAETVAHLYCPGRLHRVFARLLDR